MPTRIDVSITLRILYIIGIQLVICINLTAYAQTTRDSLWNIWSDTQASEINRGMHLYNIAKDKDLLHAQPDSSLYYSDLLFEYAKSKNHKLLLAKAQEVQATAYLVKGNLNLAYEKFTSALQGYNYLKLPIAASKLKNSMGIIHFKRAEYNQALELYLSSLDVLEKQNDLNAINNALTNIGLVYLIQDRYALAIKQFLRCLDISTQLNDTVAMARAHDNIGNTYNTKGDYYTAIEHYELGLSLLENTNAQLQLRFSYSNIGVVYQKQGNYAQAIHYYMAALNLNEHLGDHKEAAKNLINIAGIYGTTKNYDIAITFYTKSLAQLEKFEDPQSKALCLENLGAIYIQQGKVDKALDHLYQSQLHHEKNGYSSSLSNVMRTIGNVYKNQKQFDLAAHYINESRRIAEQLQNTEQIALSLISSAEIDLQSGLHKPAITKASKALEIGRKNGNLHIKQHAALLLRNAYANQGRFRLALQHYEVFIQMTDSLNSLKNQRAMIRQEYNYHYKKKALADSLELSKEKLILKTNTKIQRLELHKKQMQNWYLLGIVVLLFLFSMLIYRRFQIIRRQQIIIGSQRRKIMANLKKMEEKSLRKQMNPHFIFNTINNLQYIMFIQGELETNKYFGYFSKLIRYTLDMNNADKIMIQKEIDYLKSYITLEKMRLDNTLNFTINTCSKLKVEETYIPCMMLQPLVENAILHGLKPKKNNRDLHISFNSKKGGFIEVHITDNGIGRKATIDQPKTPQKKHRSWATFILNERIKIFNAQNKKQITFKIIDLENNGKALGTKVELVIPT